MSAELKSYLREIEDLKNIAERMWLDQQSVMPKGALEERTRQTGLLQRLVQERMTSDRLGDLLAQASGNEPWLDVVTADRETALQLSGGVWQRFLETGAEAFGVWEQARRENDWATFAPWLAKMVEINREYADAIGYSDHPMDTLLSVYAPGPTHQEISTVFEEMRGFLVDARPRRRIEQVESEGKVEPHLLDGIAYDIGELLGFDVAHGGVAFSPHGYTSSAGPLDVRITFRKDVALFEAVSTIVHEYGHALYSQGVAPEMWGTSAQAGSMPYIQESQAKFWENIVGRREDFAQLIGGILAERLGKRNAQDWGLAYHRSLTRTPASPIRISSDEISFNLHIMLRFEIEQALLDGSISVDEVPDVWNAKSESYLDVVPQTLAQGALQDPHWTRRMFGLFTAYVIGNVSSAQLGSAMEAQDVSLADAVSRGDFSQVLGWLRTNVHAPGRTVSVQQMLINATGGSLNAAPYRRHIETRYLT